MLFKIRLYALKLPVKVKMEFYKSASQRAMRAMRATVKMLRIFICYNYIRMRTRTRATEQDKYIAILNYTRPHKLPSFNSYRVKI